MLANETVSPPMMRLFLSLGPNGDGEVLVVTLNRNGYLGPDSNFEFRHSVELSDDSSGFSVCFWVNAYRFAEYCSLIKLVNFGSSVKSSLGEVLFAIHSECTYVTILSFCL